MSQNPHFVVKLIIVLVIRKQILLLSVANCKSKMNLYQNGSKLLLCVSSAQENLIW